MLLKMTFNTAVWSLWCTSHERPSVLFVHDQMNLTRWDHRLTNNNCVRLTELTVQIPALLSYTLIAIHETILDYWKSYDSGMH